MRWTAPLIRRCSGAGISVQNRVTVQVQPKTKSSPRLTERRSGVDRRRADKGPPGRHERRVGVEPRQPEVQEVNLTPSEWATLGEIAHLPGKKPVP
jgi:hypothetical protein